MRTLIALALVLASCACGHKPDRLGVLVNQLPATKARVGNADAGVVVQDRWPGTDERFARADVVGDGRPEALVVADASLDIDIRDSAGQLLGHIKRGRYITDVGGVPGDGDKQRILLNEGGAFTAMDADGSVRARWQEPHDPGHFAVAPWKGRPGVFYLLDDQVVIRSPQGEVLGKLPAPQAHLFGRPYVTAVADRTVVVAAGSGYTPYHMVCIYSPDGTLVYQEMNDELAYGLASEPDHGAFTVTTRTTVWRYTIP